MTLTSSFLKQKLNILSTLQAGTSYIEKGKTENKSNATQKVKSVPFLHMK